MNTPLPRRLAAPRANFSSRATRSRRSLRTLGGLAAAWAILGLMPQGRALAQDKPASAPARAALSVTVTTPQAGDWPVTVAANGSIAAWQEAVIGAEAGGLRLTQVLVNVGDVVKRGQLLAQLQSSTLRADLAATQAGLDEARAVIAEAQANAERARALQESGAISAQQIQQYVTAEQTARARAEALRARLAADQQRLEWRAEVPAADLARLRKGLAVQVTPAGGAAVRGVVRMVAPTVDVATRNGLVYVDLPQPGAAKAGMFARGQFELGSARGMTLPQSALLLRDGFSYVFRVGADHKVVLTKVAVGRRLGERVEVTGGLDPAARVVAAGGGFLGDGDTVRVVTAPTAPVAPAAPASRTAAAPAAK